MRSNSSLAGLRILDLSRVLAGPWASQILADLGAEVIKIERPRTGDDTRSWGPPFAKDEAGCATSQSAYYLSANRGKKSVTVDFTKPEGQEIVRRLVRQCDVVLENFKVGGLKAYGLDYDRLKAEKPDLIYCSITGFGQTGPYAHRPGYDFILQAMGGLMSITGKADDEPMKTGVAVTDLFTGLYAVIGILAALRHRDQTGQGQQIDLSLFDCQVAVLANQAANYLTAGVVPQRLGNAHPSIVPYQVFATQDSHMVLAIGNDQQFARFCALAGCEDLAQDPRAATNQARVENRAMVIDRLKPILQACRTEEWLDRLTDAEIPCAPINSLDQVFADPHLRDRKMVVSIPHPEAGQIEMVANPLHLSQTPIHYDTPPPLLGADTEQVLEERLGLSIEDIKGLREKNSI